ncbi:MAG: hypothetical protein PHE78_01515 [Candidatus Gastranaerophilales bacterium]|nr:hypothetical protein [Candidatus Gastranaerophilales bacterium]
MKINNSDRATFGTKVFVGSIGASNALPKYNKTLAQGLLDGVKKLSENNINNQVVLDFYPNIASKRLKNDVVEISYFEKPISSLQDEKKSSMQKSLTSLERMDPDGIAKWIEDACSSLMKSKSKKPSLSGYPKPRDTKITKGHKEKIQTLVDTFGYDDWVRY